MIDEAFINQIQETWIQWKALSAELRRVKYNRPFNQITISSVFGALTAMGYDKDVKLFVITYIFTPEVLAGVKMRTGYREYISSLFEYKTGCAISRRVKNLMFNYRNYKDFKAKANEGVAMAEKVLENMKK